MVTDALRGLRFGPLEALLVAAVAAGSVYLLATPHPFWALVPGPLVLALYLLGRYPQFALYLFIFLIPFEFLTRWSPTQQEITVSKFLGLWIVVVSLLMLLVGRWQARHLRSVFWPFIAAFLLVNLVATLNSDYLATAAGDLRQLAVAVTVFALVLLLTTRHGFQAVFPTVLIWGVLINYAIFLLEFRYGVRLPWTTETIYQKDVSMPAYALPTGYSVYFVFLIPFLVHRFFFSAGFLRRALYAALTLATLSGIVYLGSRASFVVTLFLIVVLAFQYLRLLRPRLVGFVLAWAFISAALVLLLIPQAYWTKQRTMFDTVTDSSVSMRVDFLKTGWELFKRKPLLGFGPGGFMEEYATTLYSAKHAGEPEDYRMRAHNTYLEVLVGSGTVGLLCFLALIGVALRNYRTAARHALEAGDLEHKLMTNAYEAAFLVNLLLFFFISYLSMKHFWIFLAVSQVALNLSKTSRHGEAQAA